MINPFKWFKCKWFGLLPHGSDCVAKIKLGRNRSIKFYDEDLWSLDIPLARIIGPNVKAFRAVASGMPYDRHTDKDDFLIEEEWDEVLGKIQYAMEMIVLDEDSTIYGERDSIDWDKVTEGLDLLGKYFKDLWW